MSPHYVKEFKRENPCLSCPKRLATPTAPGRAFCPGHLIAARLGWRTWAVERRTKGLCCECDRRGHLDRNRKERNCRCKAHRERNRVKCARWVRENPSAGARAYAKRRDIINSGYCICPMRNALKPRQRRCDDCRAYSRALGVGDVVTFEKIRAKKKAAWIARIHGTVTTEPVLQEQQS
jgi:hypothetical protein